MEIQKYFKEFCRGYLIYWHKNCMVPITINQIKSPTHGFEKPVIQWNDNAQDINKTIEFINGLNKAIELAACLEKDIFD